MLKLFPIKYITEKPGSGSRIRDRLPCQDILARKYTEEMSAFLRILSYVDDFARMLQHKLHAIRHRPEFGLCRVGSIVVSVYQGCFSTPTTSPFYVSAPTHLHVTALLKCWSRRQGAGSRPFICACSFCPSSSLRRRSLWRRQDARPTRLPSRAAGSWLTCMYQRLHVSVHRCHVRWHVKAGSWATPLRPQLPCLNYPVALESTV